MEKLTLSKIQGVSISSQVETPKLNDKKIDNVITEKDICITFVKSNTYCYFTNSEKKKLLLK